MGSAASLKLNSRDSGQCEISRSLVSSEIAHPTAKSGTTFVAPRSSHGTRTNPN